MTAPRHAQTTEKKALLIGIEYTGSRDKDALPLPGIKNDLEGVKHTLITYWSYKESNIVTMTDSAVEHLKPTKENIVSPYLLVSVQHSSLTSLHFTFHSSAR